MATNVRIRLQAKKKEALSDALIWDYINPRRGDFIEVGGTGNNGFSMNYNNPTHRALFEGRKFHFVRKEYVTEGGVIFTDLIWK